MSFMLKLPFQALESLFGQANGMDVDIGVAVRIF